MSSSRSPTLTQSAPYKLSYRYKVSSAYVSSSSLHFYFSCNQHLTSGYDVKTTMLKFAWHFCYVLCVCRSVLAECEGLQWISGSVIHGCSEQRLWGNGCCQGFGLALCWSSFKQEVQCMDTNTHSQKSHFLPLYWCKLSQVSAHMCFSHFPPASLMSQWNMTATPCRKTQPITSQNVQKPQMSRVVIWTWRGHIFSKPLSPDLLHTYAGQLRHNAEPLQTRRFEHLNHSAEASSWVTFWNLTKEQYKLISIVFSCLLTDIGPCVCAYCQGHSPVTTNLWGSDQKSEVDLSSDSSLSTSSCFCCLTFALIPTSEGNFRS